MTDLLRHLKPLTLYEIEADLEDIYARLVHWSQVSATSTEIADIGAHLAAVSEELARRDKEDEG